MVVANIKGGKKEWLYNLLMRRGRSNSHESTHQSASDYSPLSSEKVTPTSSDESHKANTAVIPSNSSSSHGSAVLCSPTQLNNDEQYKIEYSEELRELQNKIKLEGDEANIAKKQLDELRKKESFNLLCELAEQKPNMDKIKEFLANGADPEYKPDASPLPIFLYAKGEALRYLLCNCKDARKALQWKSTNGDTAIHVLAKTGDFQNLPFILDMLNSNSSKNNTNEGKEEQVDWVNLKNDFGQTPIELAIQYNKKGAIKTLLHYGAPLEHVYANSSYEKVIKEILKEDKENAKKEAKLIIQMCEAKHKQAKKNSKRLSRKLSE